MSHTVTVKTEIRWKGPLGDAARRMGGEILGDGVHELYGDEVRGFAVKLPGWKFPIVLTTEGELKFDNYSGAWGADADLEKLKGEYAIEMAISKCSDLGWQVQRETDGSLTIFVPGGGTVQVTREGTVDAMGFTGSSCDSAVTAIAEALGNETARFCKPERNAVLNEARVIT